MLNEKNIQSGQSTSSENTEESSGTQYQKESRKFQIIENSMKTILLNIWFCKEHDWKTKRKMIETTLEKQGIFNSNLKWIIKKINYWKRNGIGLKKSGPKPYLSQVEQEMYNFLISNNIPCLDKIYLQHLAKNVFQNLFGAENDFQYLTKNGKIKKFKASAYFIWNFKKRYNLTQLTTIDLDALKQQQSQVIVQQQKQELQHMISNEQNQSNQTQPQQQQNFEILSYQSSMPSYQGGPQNYDMQQNQIYNQWEQNYNQYQQYPQDGIYNNNPSLSSHYSYYPCQQNFENNQFYCNQHAQY